MSDRHESITPEISTWIREQRAFFVATAPRALDGHVNVSPKGGDSFRVLGPLEVVYRISAVVARTPPPMLARMAELSSCSALFKDHPKSGAYTDMRC